MFWPVVARLRSSGSLLLPDVNTYNCGQTKDDRCDQNRGRPSRIRVAIGLGALQGIMQIEGATD